MAKQLGVFKADGTIGDFSFYDSKDGPQVRLKKGVDGQRIQSDPAFARTRENGMEFGRAAKRAQLIRTALRSVIQRAHDRRSAIRMHRNVLRVLHTDTVSKRGERDVIGGDLGLLQGFNFNVGAPLHSTVYFQPTVSVDRVAGEVVISIPEFVPTAQLEAPKGSTHFRLMSGSAELDWLANESASSHEESEWIPLDDSSLPAMDLMMSIESGSTDPVLVALGVEFGQEVNSDVYILNNGAFNALAIVDVDTA